MTFPQYAVSKWIGHSIAISGRHYANAVPDELFDKAAEHGVAPRNSAQRHAQRNASDRPRNEQKSNDNASQPESAKSRGVQTLRILSAHYESGEKWSRGESNPRKYGPDDTLSGVCPLDGPSLVDILADEARLAMARNPSAGSAAVVNVISRLRRVEAEPVEGRHAE
ncbi:MAG TPA: hypothetical protein ENJ00_06000 [Phycisphaerales bacterium]|nr:hypothetical protein [Phycisphaerales bacterium]